MAEAAQPVLACTIHKAMGDKGFAAGTNSSCGWSSAKECRSRVRARSLVLFLLSPSSWAVFAEKSLQCFLLLTKNLDKCWLTGHKKEKREQKRTTDDKKYPVDAGNYKGDVHVWGVGALGAHDANIHTYTIFGADSVVPFNFGFAVNRSSYSGPHKSTVSKSCIQFGDPAVTFISVGGTAWSWSSEHFNYSHAKHTSSHSCSWLGKLQWRDYKRSGDTTALNWGVRMCLPTENPTSSTSKIKET